MTANAKPAPIDDFVWRDGERIIVFKRGALEQAPELLSEHGYGEYDLLSTSRALREAPRALEAVGSVHEVPAGPVPEAAKKIMATVRSVAIVALGGGRVIDTAKAIVAVKGGRVAAIPTTLSGAEMTTHPPPARGTYGPGARAPRARARRPGGDDQPARGPAARERHERRSRTAPSRSTRRFETPSPRWPHCAAPS